MSLLDTRTAAPYSVIVKPVSARCNLACQYCYYLRVSGMYPDAGDALMSDEVLEVFTRQVLADSPGRAVFAWQGGEPLLAGVEFFEKALRLQRRCAAPGQSVQNTIQTNGTLIDEAWCEFFRKRGVLVGLSLDGPADLHDRFRRYRDGSPVHADVLRALRLMQRENVEFNVLTVVSQANVDHGGRVFRYLADLGVNWMQFIACTERRSDGAPTSHSVDGPGYGRFICEVFDAWCPDHVGRVSVRIFENIAQRATGGPPELCIFSPTCGTAVVLEANGDLYACDHFVYEDYKLGNVLETPIRTLVRGEPCQRLAAAKMQQPEACKTCPYEGLCYGGCPKNRFDPVTRTFGDPVLCEGYRMLFEKAFEPIREIGWRAVRGEPLIPPSAPPTPAKKRKR